MWDTDKKSTGVKSRDLGYHNTGSIPKQHTQRRQRGCPIIIQITLTSTAPPEIYNTKTIAVKGHHVIMLVICGFQNRFTNIIFKYLWSKFSLVKFAVHSTKKIHSK